MEKFLTKSEIRNRLRAITGHGGSDAQSGQTQERHDEFIRLANEDVLTRRRWRATQKEYAFTLGIDQRFYPFPTNCRAGNVIDIAVWSNGIDTTSGHYVRLKRSSIPLTFDTDPISDAGGDPAAAQRAFPTRFHLKDQIEIWPRPDQQYLAKMDHTISPDLSSDGSVTVVDAIAILALACGMEFDHLGDDVAAQKYEARGEKRLRQIAAWQDHGEVVSLDDMAVMHRFETMHHVDAGLIVDQRRPG